MLSQVKPEFAGIQVLWLQSKYLARNWVIVYLLVFLCLLAVSLWQKEQIILSLREECPPEALAKIIDGDRVKCALRPSSYADSQTEIRAGWRTRYDGRNKK